MGKKVFLNRSQNYIGILWNLVCNFSVYSDCSQARAVQGDSRMKDRQYAKLLTLVLSFVC